MTDDERLRAFAMRQRGLSWEEIGSAMHYDGHTIANNLKAVLDKSIKFQPIIYPAVLRALRKQYGGSITKLSEAMHTSRYRLRRSLTGQDPMSETTAIKLMAALNLKEEDLYVADD